jgi:hypothetical protein
MSSAVSTASYLTLHGFKGKKVYVIGEPGLHTTLNDAGVSHSALAPNHRSPAAPGHIPSVRGHSPSAPGHTPSVHNHIPMSTTAGQSSPRPACLCCCLCSLHHQLLATHHLFITTYQCPPRLVRAHQDRPVFAVVCAHTAALLSTLVHRMCRNLCTVTTVLLLLLLLLLTLLLLLLLLLHLLLLLLFLLLPWIPDTYNRRWRSHPRVVRIGEGGASCSRPRGGRGGRWVVLNSQLRSVHDCVLVYSIRQSPFHCDKPRCFCAVPARR